MFLTLIDFLQSTPFDSSVDLTFLLFVRNTSPPSQRVCLPTYRPHPEPPSFPYQTILVCFPVTPTLPFQSSSLPSEFHPFHPPRSRTVKYRPSLTSCNCVAPLLVRSEISAGLPYPMKSSASSSVVGFEQRFQEFSHNDLGNPDLKPKRK